VTTALLIFAVLTGALAAALAVALLRLRDQKERSARLAGRNHELNSIIQSSELRSLRYKLNPHLFKNALNSIQSHAYQTYYAMDKLSGVLDYILYESDQPLVSLDEEMDFAANFIEINRLKVSPLFDLSVKNNVAETDELRILPLSTVDLIENAFKHTDFQKNESFIAIAFHLKNGLFTLDVRNRISEKDAPRKRNSGMGLSMLEERLKIAYPEKHTLITEKQGNVFHASLQIDLNVKAS
jgi:LytS/YehU family sensor histidine kinase